MGDWIDEAFANRPANSRIQEQTAPEGAGKAAPSGDWIDQAFANRGQKQSLSTKERPELTWWNGIKEWWANPSRTVPAVGAALEAYDVGVLLVDSNAMADGTATPEQEARVYQHLDHASREGTAGYYAVTLLSYLPAFWYEFASTGGIATATRGTAKVAAKKGLGIALQRAIRSTLGQGAKQRALRHATKTAVGAVAGVAAGEARRGVTGMMAPRLVGSLLQEALPEYEFTPDELGGLSVVVGEKNDDFVELMGVAYRGWMRHWMELVSESSGAALKLIPPLPQVAKVQGWLLNKYATETGKSMVEAGKKLAAKTGWDGIFEEWGEERVNAALGSLFLGDDPAGIIPSGPQGAGELIGLTLGAGAQRGLSALQTPDQRFAQRESTRPAKEGGQHQDMLDDLAARNPIPGTLIYEVESDDELEVDAEFARDLGVDVVWFDVEGQVPILEPGVSRGNTVGVWAGGSSTSRRRSILYHEIVHNLEDEHGVEFEELATRLEAADPKGFARALKAYKSESQEELPPEQERGEQVARYVEDLGAYVEATLQDATKLAKLEAKDSSLLASIAEAVAGAAEKVGVDLPIGAGKRKLQAAKYFAQAIETVKAKPEDSPARAQKPAAKTAPVAPVKADPVAVEPQLSTPEPVEPQLETPEDTSEREETPADDATVATVETTTPTETPKKAAEPTEAELRAEGQARRHEGRKAEEAGFTKGDKEAEATAKAALSKSAKAWRAAKDKRDKIKDAGGTPAEVAVAENKVELLRLDVDDAIGDQADAKPMDKFAEKSQRKAIEEGREARAKRREEITAAQPKPKAKMTAEERRRATPIPDLAWMLPNWEVSNRDRPSDAIQADERKKEHGGFKRGQFVVTKKGPITVGVIDDFWKRPDGWVATVYDGEGGNRTMLLDQFMLLDEQQEAPERPDVQADIAKLKEMDERERTPKERVLEKIKEGELDPDIYDDPNRLAAEVVKEVERSTPKVQKPSDPSDPYSGREIAEGIYFASGLSRSNKELFNRMNRGEAVGVSLHKNLTQKVRQALVDYAEAGGWVFIDSGSFTAFKKSEEQDWPRIFHGYRELIGAVSRDNRKNLFVVAPDVIGDHEATMDLYDQLIGEFHDIMAMGPALIVPVQQGGGGTISSNWADLTDYFDQDDNDTAIVGIPFNAKAWRQEDVLEFLRQEDGFEEKARIHLLGGGLTKVEDLIYKAKQEGLGVGHVGGDALAPSISRRRRGEAEKTEELPAQETTPEPTLEVKPDGKPVPTIVSSGPDESGPEAPPRVEADGEAGGSPGGRAGEDSGPGARGGDADAESEPASDAIPTQGVTSVPGLSSSERGRDSSVDSGNSGRAAAVRNYRITDADELGKGGAKTKARGNLAAIRTMQLVRREKRPATVDEQAVLVKYVGWGATELAQGMFSAEPKKGWEKLSADLRSMLTDEEYERARSSTLNAHYTSEDVVRSIWEAVEGFGFKGGAILEPGMGTGNFVGLMPGGVSNASSYVGIELDPTTAQIAELLYPESKVVNESYGTFKAPKEFFDLAIGNPPFAKQVVSEDPEYKKLKLTLHDFFFAKTIDRLRPGGLMVFITSRYTMDKIEDTARAYLEERADLLGAIRLPQTAFKANAGTEVVTDVLFFQKRMPGAEPAGEAWGASNPLVVGESEFSVNEYYQDNPRMLLGTHSSKGSMYGANEYTVEPKKSVPIKKDFERAVEALPVNVYGASNQDANAPDKPAAMQFAPDEAQDGSFFLVDGELHTKSEGVAKKVMPRKKGIPGGIPKTDIARIKALLPVKDAVRATLAAQLQGNDGEAERVALNKVYDKFVKKHGPINKTTVSESVDKKGRERVTRRMPNLRAFEEDPDAWLVASIEDYDEEKDKAKKAPIFRQRVIDPEITPQITSAADALNVVLNQFGVVDLDKIAQMREATTFEMIDELQGAIYLNPRGNVWETADAYLSGNVRQKLVEAKQAAELESKYQINVDALDARQPVDLTPSQVPGRLGMPWIEAKDIMDFGREVIDLPSLKVSHSATGNLWSVNVSSREGRSIASTADWGTERRPAFKILDALLSSRQIKVIDVVRNPDGGSSNVTNHVETAAANEKAQKMREAFAGWLWTDAKRADRLLKVYNRDYNNTRQRDFDGSHLSLPGLVGKEILDPHEHQKRVVWRIIQTGNTYMAHSVGSGKTFAMVMAGMEMRRLGLVKKPTYVVPNHMLAQFSREFLVAYPSASILVADEKQFEKKNRKRFVGRVATGDWDGVIITHSAFEKLPVSVELESAEIMEELAEYRAALAEMPAGTNSVKQIEAKINAMQARLAKLTDRSGKDTGLTFEETGIDFMFVDEAHYYRKLQFPTNMGDIKGIDPTGANKSWDFYLKNKYLNARNPGRSCCLASGTPITNTMAEAFTISRYLQPEALRERSIHKFDAWAANFGDSETALEMVASGGWKPVTRFAKFVNLPELGQMVRQVMDVVNAADLTYLKRPVVKGAPRRLIATPMTDDLEAYGFTLRARVKAIENRRGRVQKGDDIIPAVIMDGTKAAVDMRLIDSALPNNPDSKLNVLIGEVMQIYKDTTPTLGTQMVFSNIGTPSAINLARGFNTYHWMREEFIRMGVDPSEIVLIGDVKKQADKLKLFGKVNRGEVRILIGSTEKMGTGVNAQDLLAAVHHLDAPWYPADLEQRDGRALRQGNTNEVIDLPAYVTEGSLDSTRWNLLEKKAGFIAAFMAGDESLREMEDLGAGANSMAAAKAMASGDVRVMELVGLEGEVQKLEAQKRSHLDGQVRKRQQLAKAQSDIPQIKTAIKLRQSVVLEEGELKDVLEFREERFAKSEEWGAKVLTVAMASMQAHQRTREDSYEGVGSVRGMEVGIQTSSWNVKSVELTVTSQKTGIREDRNIYPMEQSAQGLAVIADNLAEQLTFTTSLEGDLAQAERTVRQVELSGASGDYQHEALLQSQTERRDELRSILHDEGKEPGDDLTEADRVPRNDEEEGGPGRHSVVPDRHAVQPFPWQVRQRVSDRIGLIDEWHANLDEAKADATRRASVFENRVLELIGVKRPGTAIGDFLQSFNRLSKEKRAEFDEIVQAIHWHIDLLDAQDQKKGTPLQQWRKFQHRLKKEHKKLFDRSQNLSPAELELADDIMRINRTIGKQAVEDDLLKSYREYYSKRLWKPLEEPVKYVAEDGSLKLWDPSMKNRVFESVLEGLSFGRELLIKSAIEAQRIGSSAMAEVTFDRQMLVEARKSGMVSSVKQKGWVRLKPAAFNAWRWVGEAETGQLYSEDLLIDADGQIFERRPLYATEELGTHLNNALGRSKIADIPFVKFATTWNSTFKKTILFTSLFHHQAFIRSFLFGSPFDAKNGLRLGLSYEAGRAAIEEFIPELRELVRAGLTLDRIQDFEEARRLEVGTIAKVLDKVPMGTTVRLKLEAALEGQTNYLFHRLGPNLKAQSALLEFRHLQVKHPNKSRTELAKVAARVANADFGGLHLERIGRDPTTQHIFQLLALAPDWTESNVRSMVLALKTDVEGKTFRELWGRVFIKAGVATVLFNMFMAAFDDEDFWDRYKKSWDEGKLRWLEADITPIYRALGGDDERRKYFSVLGHFRDPIKFLTHPGRSAKHKGSVISGIVLEALEGSDWAGRGFTSYDELLGIDDKGVYKTTRKGHYKAGDPKGGKLAGETVAFRFGGKGALSWSQLPSFLLNQARGVTPIQMQNAMGWLTGEVDGFDAITKSLGLMTSTTYVDDEEGGEVKRLASEEKLIRIMLREARKAGDAEKVRTLRSTLKDNVLAGRKARHAERERQQ